MTEIVASSVASEVVSRISSFLSGEKKCQESAEEKAERLEVAVLKIQSIVAVSDDLQISHIPLFQWKDRLKRVAKDGEDLLHLRKKKILQSNNGVTAAGASSPLSQHLIRAAKRFVPFWPKDGELSDNTLRRFERIADGADSFFRVVESSGRPKRNISMPSLTRSLLAGKSIEFCLQGPSSIDHLVVWPRLDPDSENGLEACLAVSSENEVMWQNNLMMVILFRLSEAANILAIVMSCLEILPPQFGSACVAIRRLLNQTVAQSNGSSSLSPKMMWCRRVTQEFLRSDYDPVQGSLHCPNASMVLPEPVLRLSSCCYASPTMDRSCSSLNNGFPVHLVCHVSPYLCPEKHSSQYLQVEQSVIWELLPKVKDGFYDHQRQALECNRQIWCPQKAMYCSVAPAISKPETLSQAYLKEKSTPNRRRRRASHTNK